MRSAIMQVALATRLISFQELTAIAMMPLHRIHPFVAGAPSLVYVDLCGS